MARSFLSSRRYRLAELLTTLLLAVAALGPAARLEPFSQSLQAAGVLRLDLVRSGFSNPVFVTHAGDSRLFVIEQGGLIKVDNGTTVSTFLDMKSLVTSSNLEQGLLGLAFDPDYANNRRFYVMYTAANGDNTISRFLRSASNPDQADSSPPTDIIRIPDFASNHNGGMIDFHGGYLYAGTGDGGGADDTRGNGQNRNVRLGKILRLDVNNPPNWVPATNPFVGVANTDPLIWAYGLRNPWRWSFDRLTGDLYIADVGQGTWEEVNTQPASSTGGENYGWNVLEGTHCFSPSSGCNTSGKVAPIHEYQHAAGNCSVTGGYVYRGSLAPSLIGKYIFGDYCSGRIWSLEKVGSTWTPTELFDTTYSISSFGQDKDGELYLTDRAGGAIYRFSETTAATSTPTSTSTSTPTATQALTATPSATTAAVAATSTRTATPGLPATSTATTAAVPATSTPTATRTPAAATATVTRTPIRTATPTRTAVPTATRTPPTFAPDLVITSFSARSAPSNHGVPVTITIRNQYFFSTSSGFDLHFFIDLGRAPIPSDGTFVGHVGTPALGLLSSRTLNITMFPDAIPPGQHTLYALIDGHDIIIERNEGNNTASTIVNVTSP